MLAWINFAALIIGGVLSSIMYVVSVSPAHMARRIGETKAYRRAGIVRGVSSIFMITMTLNYILYRTYPLPIDPFPPRFAWPYGVSIVIAVLIAIPSLYLMFRGMRDAGRETMLPAPDHTLYGGIYQHIRHPQAVGEVMLWFVMALLLNSPFLTAFSVVWLPVWYGWCLAEERDLLLRYGDAYRDYMDRTGRIFPRRKPA